MLGLENLSKVVILTSYKNEKVLFIYIYNVGDLLLLFDMRSLLEWTNSRLTNTNIPAQYNLLTRCQLVSLSTSYWS